MLVPVHIGLGAGGATAAEYDRSIELTSRQLKAFEHEAGDLRAPLGAVAEDLHLQVQAAFASQGSSGASGRWTQLSEPYGKWKAQHVPGVPILVGLRPTQASTKATKTTKATKATRGKHGTRAKRPTRSYDISGQMREQLLVPIGNTEAWFIDSRRLVYHPTSDIAGFHETGTEKMPARPPVALTLAFLHSVDRQFVRWLAQAMKRAGV